MLLMSDIEVLNQFLHKHAKNGWSKTKTTRPAVMALFRSKQCHYVALQAQTNLWKPQFETYKQGVDSSSPSGPTDALPGNIHVRTFFISPSTS